MDNESMKSKHEVDPTQKLFHSGFEKEHELKNPDHWREAAELYIQAAEHGCTSSMNR